MYWRAPYLALAGLSDLVEFTVLDIESIGTTRGRWVLADAQVALSGAFRSQSALNGSKTEMDHENSWGTTQIFHTRTHLGAILQPGDTTMGYYLSSANFNSDDFAAIPADRIPDVVLVKKAYPNRRKKGKSRNWKLRSIAKEQGETEDTGNGRGVVGRMGGRDQRKVDEEYELFLRDLEEDPELRGAVNLYKVKDVKMKDAAERPKRHHGQYAMDVDEEAKAESDVESKEEPDFPDVQLSELLEEFDEMTLEETP